MFFTALKSFLRNKFEYKNNLMYRNHKAVRRFFKKALRSFHVSRTRVITVDKNPAYPVAIEKLRKEKKMPLGIQIRQIKYLNNIEEQDYRFIKKRIRSMMGFNHFKQQSLY
jgi:transposase-like protein